MKLFHDRYYLNDDWKFSQHFTEDMIQNDYSEDDMEAVRLPHTNQILPYHYVDADLYQMVCAYRLPLDGNELAKAASSSNLGKEHCRYLLTFEGAAHEATVYCNGKKLLVHSCGYTAFTIDLTDCLRLDADNVLTVRLDSRETLNQPPFGHVIDYMTYGGLYREVYLEIRPERYLKDIFVHTTRVQSDQKQLIAEIELNDPSIQTGQLQQQSDRFTIVLSLLDAEGAVHTKFHEVELDTTRSVTTLSEDVEQVKLWTLERPVLYRLKVELRCNGILLEERFVRFGFREVRFAADGFYLNGQKIKIRGINRHQSYPYVGYAMPQSMQVMDADIIHDELGFNAVRTSHYPQSQHFLNRCDELGLLVFTEIPGWQHVGDATWKEVLCHDVSEMVEQYRNHPSIILWGVRVNESQDDDALYSRTNQIVHQMDPSRPTGGVRYLKKSSLLEDVYTYNDFLYDGTTAGADQKKRVTSDLNKGYLISEYNGHMFPTKAYDTEEHRLEHALRHAAVVNAYYAADDIAGGFGWCLFDYNTHKDFGSGDNICYHGIADYFRNPKLAANVYRSFGTQPFLTISSSMDIGEHPASRLGDIYAFTNADAVRFYKNGTLIREFLSANKDYPALPHPPVLLDDIIGNQLVEREGYSVQKSEDVKQVLLDAARNGMNHVSFSSKCKALKLLTFGRMKYSDAYNLYGKYVGDWGNVAKTYRFDAVLNGRVVQTVIKEPVQRVHLQAITDHTELRETTSYDVAAIRIQAVDQHQNVLSYYNDAISLSVTGPLELIGPSILSLNGGMGGTYVKTTGQVGEGKLIIRDCSKATKTSHSVQEESHDCVIVFHTYDR